MPTARLADRQIRAAAHAALRLDVRGPVSQALARTGIEVPVDAAAVPPPASASERPPARRPSKAAPRVFKPFDETPWPTRRARASEPDALSGLTADERRVHRILIDTLALQPSDGFTSVPGLASAERRRLEVLDLAYIDAQLAGLSGGGVDVKHWTTLVTAATGGIMLALGIAGTGAADGALLLGGVLLLLVSVGVAAGLIPTSTGVRGGQRRAIFQALRELALLAHADDAASDALARADQIIDRLADADEAPAPFLALPDDRLSDDAPRTRARVRS